MPKKILLVSVAVVYLFLTGCGTSKINKSDDFSGFYVSGPYWSGGMGSMPILESARGNVKEQDGLPIFIDEDSAEIIRAKMPSCYSGNTEVKVAARIQLEKKESIATSVPLDEDGNQPMQSYYSAKVLELKDVKIKTEPCDDEVVADIVLDEEKFVLTTEPQDAVFYISIGMDGGMGSMLVLNRRMEDLAILFDENFGDNVREKMPSCYEGKPEIKISAKIQLEKKIGINESIPPDDFGNQPEESYYTARVLELKDIQVKAEECED